MGQIFQCKSGNALSSLYITRMYCISYREYIQVSQKPSSGAIFVKYVTTWHTKDVTTWHTYDTLFAVDKQVTYLPDATASISR